MLSVVFVICFFFYKLADMCLFKSVAYTWYVSWHLLLQRHFVSGHLLLSAVATDSIVFV